MSRPPIRESKGHPHAEPPFYFLLFTFHVFFAVRGPMNVPKSIFRQYDVRGIVGAELTPELARGLGRAFATVAWDRVGHAPVIVVGRDNRPSGGALADGIRLGIVDAG